MTKEPQKILVYTDFTEYGDVAIKNAITLSKLFEKRLAIVHAIDDNTKSLFGKKEVFAKTEETLIKLKKEIEDSHSINCDIFFDEGCNCEIINSTAIKIDAFLVVLGIHDKYNIQYLNPKYALKFIRKSRVPYLVTSHHKHITQNYNNILVTIDHTKQSKEKINWASYFAKNQKATVQLIVSDSQNQQVSNNLLFAKKIFDTYNVKYHINTIKKSVIGIQNHSGWLAQNYNCNLIIMMASEKVSLWNYLFGQPEVQIICNNNKIPVLSLNPRKDLYVPCV